jgi:hypothetical protein
MVAVIINIAFHSLKIISEFAELTSKINLVAFLSLNVPH